MLRLLRAEELRLFEENTFAYVSPFTTTGESLTLTPCRLPCLCLHQLTVVGGISLCHGPLLTALSAMLSRKSRWRSSIAQTIHPARCPQSQYSSQKTHQNQTFSVVACLESIFEHSNDPEHLRDLTNAKLTRLNEQIANDRRAINSQLKCLHVAVAKRLLRSAEHFHSRLTEFFLTNGVPPAPDLPIPPVERKTDTQMRAELDMVRAARVAQERNSRAAGVPITLLENSLILPRAGVKRTRTKPSRFGSPQPRR
jgi:hypothetical protein